MKEASNNSVSSKESNLKDILQPVTLVTRKPKKLVQSTLSFAKKPAPVKDAKVLDPLPNSSMNDDVMVLEPPAKGAPTINSQSSAKKTPNPKPATPAFTKKPVFKAKVPSFFSRSDPSSKAEKSEFPKEKSKDLTRPSFYASNAPSLQLSFPSASTIQDELESEDVFQPKLFEMPKLTGSHVDPANIFTLLVVFDFLKKFGTSFLNLSFAIENIDQLVVLLNNPHEGFQQLLEIYGSMLSLLLEQKKPALFAVQKKLVAYLGNQSDVQDLVTEFSSKDWYLIDKAIHIKTLNWFCDQLCDLLNNSAKKAKIEASKCTAARLALVDEREKKSNTLKDISSISAEMSDQDPLIHPNSALTNALTAKLEELNSEIKELDRKRDSLSLFADSYLARPPPVVSFFMGLDRFGRAYWWVSPHGPSKSNAKNSLIFSSNTSVELDLDKYCFGVIAEDGYSSLSKPSYTVTEFGADLINLVSTLTHSGKRERALSQHLNLQISKYCKIGDSDYRDKIDLGVKRFKEWLTALIDLPPQDFNGISEYNAFFFPLVKGKIAKLASVHGIPDEQINLALKAECMSLPKAVDCLQNWQKKGLLNLLTSKQIELLYTIPSYSFFYGWVNETLRDVVKEIEQTEIRNELMSKAATKYIDPSTEILGKRRVEVVDYSIPPMPVEPVKKTKISTSSKTRSKKRRRITDVDFSKSRIQTRSGQRRTSMDEKILNRPRRKAAEGLYNDVGTSRTSKMVDSSSEDSENDFDSVTSSNSDSESISSRQPRRKSFKTIDSDDSDDLTSLSSKSSLSKIENQEPSSQIDDGLTESDVEEV